MKVYFTGSLHNRDIDIKLYEKIVKALESLGHTVKFDHILGHAPGDLETQTTSERQNYYQRLRKWISYCDVVVCEVSYPSTLSIGHEVSLALDMGKPVIALYQKKREPGVLQGVNSEKFILLEYDEKDLISVLEYGIEESEQQIDVRFNFFVSPRIQQYLDWVAKYKRTPRAVYLRELLERDMKENKDWKKQK